MTPSVSVCLCTYNGVDVVHRALDSILSQSWSNLEVLVVDDASTDGTVSAVSRYNDPRLRLVRNVANLGNSRNRSFAARLSRGEFIKFVDQDDYIADTCIEEHLRILSPNPSVGLTFSRRSLVADPQDLSDAAEWITRYRDPHRGLGPLDELSDGMELVRRHIDASLRENWIGEPTSVMLRRAVLERSGLFSRELRQTLDLDLWLRVMAFSEVGFIDAELATRSVGRATETQDIRSVRRDWLDRLWLLEGLKQVPELWLRFPELQAMLLAERRSLLVSLWTGRYRTESLRDALTDAARYGGYATAAAAGRGRPLFDRL